MGLLLEACCFWGGGKEGEGVDVPTDPVMCPLILWCTPATPEKEIPSGHHGQIYWRNCLKQNSSYKPPE